MEEQKLEGGFINEVFLKVGVLVKRFANSGSVGISNERYYSVSTIRKPRDPFLKYIFWRI